MFWQYCVRLPDVVGSQSSSCLLPIFDLEWGQAKSFGFFSILPGSTSASLRDVDLVCPLRLSVKNSASRTTLIT